MTAYYNEIDPYCADWLRNLILENLIAPGYVDERDIRDVKPYELQPYTQCHFFAGLGGWSYACRLAGIPDNFPLWTGSCPCQPFSAAGQGGGFDDERHLWPYWHYLIAQRRPATVFGEQVAAAVGRSWLDLVCSDLEGEGYACGAAVLPACSVGAPHIRQRLWFVADSSSTRFPERIRNGGIQPEAMESCAGQAVECGIVACELANGNGSRCGERRPSQARNGRDASWIEPPGFCATIPMEHAASEQVGLPRCARQSRSADSALGNAESERETETRGFSGGPGAQCDRSFWSETEWLECRDGKTRPTKPGLFPLAHGISARVGKLRAAGNAIVPEVAAQFMKASLALRS